MLAGKCISSYFFYDFETEWCRLVTVFAMLILEYVYVCKDYYGCGGVSF